MVPEPSKSGEQPKGFNSYNLAQIDLLARLLSSVHRPVTAVTDEQFSASDDW